MARVLTTAAGGDIGIGAIQSLQKASHETIAVDMDSYAAGLYIADHGISVPAATDEEWPAVMSDIVNKYDVDVVIPLLDQELQESDRLESALQTETPIIIPRKKLIKKTLDKKEMYEYFEKKGLRIPDTRVATDLDELIKLKGQEFPKIVKPRHGQGSQGIHIIHTPDELQQYISKTEVNERELLIQDFIEGTEFTSNVSVDKNNNLLSVVTKEVPERSMQSGTTKLGITRENPIVYEACVSAYEALSPRGPMNVQHVLDQNDVPYLIEINPRFSGSSCLTVEAGVNEFDLLVRDALGEDIKPIDGYETGLSLIRYTDQIYVEERDLIN